MDTHVYVYMPFNYPSSKTFLFTYISVVLFTSKLDRSELVGKKTHWHILCKAEL